MAWTDQIPTIVGALAGGGVLAKAIDWWRGKDLDAAEVAARRAEIESGMDARYRALLDLQDERAARQDRRIAELELRVAELEAAHRAEQKRVIDLEREVLNREERISQLEQQETEVGTRLAQALTKQAALAEALAAQQGETE